MVNCEAIRLPEKTLGNSSELLKGNLATEVKMADSKDLQLIHLYILHNTSTGEPYIAKHLDYVRDKYRKKIEK